MTVERVVDAHVHLWDPARADWYPYLAGMQELDMGDISGMCRRFDQPIYFSEAAKWNVQKFVHVAAAAPHDAGRRDARARRAGRRDGASRRAHRWPRPERRHRRARAPARRADGVEALPRHPDHGRGRRRRFPPRRSSKALQDRGLIFELMVHPDQLDPAAAGARRLGAAGGGGAHRVAAVERSRGVRALEDRAWRPWPVSGRT